MRFAIKTSPQNTTWDDMLAVWRAADDIDVFESGWTFDHFYPIFSDPTGPVPRGLGHHHRPGPGHPPAAGRRAGDRQRLPPPGRAGQHGGDPRHHLRRSPRARARRGVERGGVRRLRHRAAAAEGALRPLRRGAARSSSGCSPTRDHRLRRPLLPADRRPLRAEADPAAAPADRDRRIGRDSARCARWPAGPSTGTSPAAASRSSSRSARSCTSTAQTSGRDPPRSRRPPTSGSTPADPGALVDEAGGARRGRARPRHRLPAAPHSPAVLEPLAEALAPLADEV